MLVGWARLRRHPWALRIILLLSAYTMFRLHTSSSISNDTSLKLASESAVRDTRFYPTSVRTKFQRLPITGFTGPGLPDGFDCSDLAVVGELNISSAIDIDDDLLEIAAGVRHPLVNYTSQGKGLSFTTLVERTWTRMGGSSVWLEEHQVFLTVSRVYFYDKGVRRWSIISFVRAQIHDAQWNHIPGYELDWYGETMVFPRIFEITIPFKPGGCFIGPEDPRIIIEHGVSDAEPVIVFNMQEDPYTLKRSMYIFRPFSNVTTRLMLDPSEHTEKNWAPFFMQSNISPNGKRWPSRWLHFVYEFHPLRIVRCHLLSGVCSWIFQQQIPESFRDKHTYYDHTLNGGSNLEPLHITGRPGITSFVGFPRTHIDEGCLEEAMYRPELTILSTNGTHFWFDYSSESLNFGSSMLKPSEMEDPCTSGRILLVNSIVYFDTRPGRDEMAVSFSVNDASVGVATIRGVRQLVESLSPYSQKTWPDSQVSKSLDLTHRISGCSIVSAIDYAIKYTTPQMQEAERIRIAKEKEKSD